MEASSRKSKADIIREVQAGLRKGDRSIKGLADDIGSQWVTVRDTVELLKELGVVSERTVSGERVFSLTQSSEKDTLFQLPIAPEDRQISSYLFRRIVEEWEKLRGTKPSRTQVQKAAVRIVIKEHLPVSFGWYLYGQTLALQYAEGQDYGVRRPDIPQRVEATIREIVREESGKTVRQAVRDNHRDNRLYECKDLVDVLLHYENLDGQRRERVETLLSQMELHLHVKNLELRELFSYFTSVCNRLLHSSVTLNDIRQHLVAAFDQTWKVIAGNYYFTSREGPVVVKTVDARDRLADRIRDAELAIATLEEFLPKRTVRASEILKMVGSSPVKFMSPEEKRLAFAELEKDSVDIFRRHNLHRAREI